RPTILRPSFRRASTYSPASSAISRPCCTSISRSRCSRRITLRRVFRPVSGARTSATATYLSLYMPDLLREAWHTPPGGRSLSLDFGDQGPVVVPRADGAARPRPFAAPAGAEEDVVDADAVPARELGVAEAEPALGERVRERRPELAVDRALHGQVEAPDQDDGRRGGVHVGAREPRLETPLADVRAQRRPRPPGPMHR